MTKSQIRVALANLPWASEFDGRNTWHMLGLLGSNWSIESISDNIYIGALSVELSNFSNCC